MDRHFENADISDLSPSPSASSNSYMASIVDAMEFFAELCILLFAKGYGGAPRSRIHAISDILCGRPEAEKQKLLATCLPSSMWEKYRIRRALLRFQLFCELFHQPGDSIYGVDNWEERLPEQEFFWLRYEWWEVEEVKCVYQILVFSLDLGLSKEISGIGTEMVQDGRLQERGLPQLRHFLDDTPRTPFGESYLRRFLARAFRGFSKADPDDLNHFSLPRPLYEMHFAAAGCKPPGTYRSLSPSPNKSRRWKPSPYPGVQLEHITDPVLNPHVPNDCRPLASNPQDMKRFVRFIGWVFWGREKLYDWVEYDKSFLEFRLEAGDFDQDWDHCGPRKPFRWKNYVQHECDY